MITPIKPLPRAFAKRFHNWRDTDYRKKQSRFEDLIDNGQHPEVMIIGCCDSRIHANTLFDGEAGEFFIHRNIANLVPPYDLDSGNTGAPAAVEFAVTTLKVKHIIVIGHSQCGGIKHGYDLFADGHMDNDQSSSFVQKWLRVLDKTFHRLNRNQPMDAIIDTFEKTSILTSIENLMGYPFVAEAVGANTLELHGLWHDIRGGNLYGYDSDKESFEAI